MNTNARKLLINAIFVFANENELLFLFSSVCFFIFFSPLDILLCAHKMIAEQRWQLSRNEWNQWNGWLMELTFIIFYQIVLAIYSWQITLCDFDQYNSYSRSVEFSLELIACVHGFSLQCVNVNVHLLDLFHFELRSFNAGFSFVDCSQCVRKKCL